MSAVKEFNGLNGKVITRDEILQLIQKAKAEEQPALVARLESVLEDYDHSKFQFTIENPEIENTPEALLKCFDCEQYDDEFESGLAKSVSPNDILNMITDKMVAMIKESKAEYKRKWKDNGHSHQTISGFLVPFNFVSKKPYRGINALMLSNMGKPMKNPYYLTFKQVEALKGSVIKGAKGHEVIYYTKLYNATDKESGKSISSYDPKKVKEFVEANNIPDAKLSNYSMLRYYNVFNGEDIQGIDFKLDKLTHGYVKKDVVASENNKFNEAEAMILNYPKIAPRIEFHGQKAYYSPSEDRVVVPIIEDFETSQDYYRTLFHELAHSTGHGSRLDREISNSFGSKKYAKEELVAEFGSVFLSAEAGIIWYNNKNHEAYLKGWNRSLTLAADDNKFFISAANDAQKIYDFILQHDEKGIPAYFADLKKMESKKVETVKKIEPKKIAPKKKISKKKVVAPVTKIEKEDPVKEVVKVDEKGQMALFGVKAPALVVDVLPPAINNSLPLKSENIGGVKSINDIGQSESQFFKVNGEVGKFLQAVERKPVGSVVITLDGMQGAGKTTTLYQFIDAFASAGNKCLFISGEEHPESFLAVEKRDKYLSSAAKSYTSIVGDVENTGQLYSMIEHFEIIFIDSWQKLLRMIGDIKLDEDLRKKFNGKVFVVIFQQTTTGRTKGGAEVVFDGDIITKLIKEASFSDNYAYFDKNRYTKIPLENIRYNIALAKTYNPNQTETEDDTPGEVVKLSFSVPEY